MVLFSHGSFPIPACMCHTCLRYVTYYMCVCVFHILHPFIMSIDNIRDIVNGRIEFQCLAKPYFMEPIISCQTFGSFPKSCSPKQSCQELRAVQWLSDPLSQRVKENDRLLNWLQAQTIFPSLHPIPMIPGPLELRWRKPQSRSWISEDLASSQRDVWAFLNPHN